MASKDPPRAQYELSTEILGHKADVRAVIATPAPDRREGIVTASRDGTACLWRPEPGAGREYLQCKVMRQHSGYVSALCVIPADPSAGRDQPLVVTGSQDKTILVHSMDPSVEEPLECYTGHKSLITCIIFQHGELVSSSWDGTVRVWKGPSQSEVMDAHKPAVWTVAGLHQHDGTYRVLSGGADHSIKLWEVDTKLCLSEYQGHTDVVRDIRIASPEVFLSAANDCSVRKWNIHSGQCLREFVGHEAFVYSLSLFPYSGEDDFASCGEDGTVRVWRGGDVAQTLCLPATSVWSVCCLENGDIVAGSSDAVARVFTTSPERLAPPQHLSVFNSQVEEHRSPAGSKIDVDSLPGLEALARPGKSTGDTLMINNDGIPEVYQWNADTEQWEKIGTATGQAPQQPSSSNTYGGKEYDFVFDIELDDGSATMRKLKLPYNKETEPYVAASEFLDSNDLPQDYLDQVASFIIQNAGEYTGPSTGYFDPFTGGSRYVPVGGAPGQSLRSGSDPFTGGGRYRPGGAGASSLTTQNVSDPFTGGGRYRPGGSEGSHEPPPSHSSVGLPPDPSSQPESVPIVFRGLHHNTYFPMNSFKTFTSPVDYASKVVAKVTEFNATVGQGQKLTEAQLVCLNELCRVLTSPGAAKATVASSDFGLVNRLLQWPAQNVFPGLDLLRLALLNDGGNNHFVGDIDNGKVFLGELMAFALGSDSQTKNQLLVLRCLANLFDKELSLQLIHQERKWILSQLSSFPPSLGKPAQVALATISMNYCHQYSVTRDPEGIEDSVKHCVELLSSSLESDAKLRALIGIGCLTLVDKPRVLVADPTDLVTLVRTLSHVKDAPKMCECAGYLLEALQ